MSLSIEEQAEQAEYDAIFAERDRLRETKAKAKAEMEDHGNESKETEAKRWFEECHTPGYRSLPMLETPTPETGVDHPKETTSVVSCKNQD